MSEKEEKKSVHWHSPESCDIQDEECVIEKLNEIAQKCSDFDPSNEIIVVGPMNQPHPDDPPERIVMVTRAPLKEGEKFTEEKQKAKVFSTHPMYFHKNGTVAFGQGHYDMTFEEAQKDLEQRKKNVKSYDYSKKGVPPHYVY